MPDAARELADCVRENSIGIRSYIPHAVLSRVPEIRMKSFSNNPNLPGNFAALRFVCGCFDIREKELVETLERMRRITKNPDAHFPKKLSREMLARAICGKGRWLEALSTIHREALYNRMRRENGKPLFSFTGKFSQEMTFTLLTLYGRLLSKINCSGVPPAQAMWLLVENVFVPTVFIKMVEEWRLGLGTEWLGETCWYLPAKSDHEIQKPISRVLDCWLRVAGFRTAYGVSQSLTRGKPNKSSLDEQTEKRWKTRKKSVERWRNGKPVQSVHKLHRLVETFAPNVAWLDEPDGWKARFTLAFAMQNLCDAMDEAFESTSKQPSLALADMLRRIANERITCDDSKRLAATDTFFASRLIQRQMRADGEWEKMVGQIPKSAGRAFPPEASDDEIARCRDEISWRMNSGNWFLEHLEQKAIAAGRLKPDGASCADYVALDSYIFDLGVEELNKLLDSKRKEAGKR